MIFLASTFCAIHAVCKWPSVLGELSEVSFDVLDRYAEGFAQFPEMIFPFHKRTDFGERFENEFAYFFAIRGRGVVDILQLVTKAYSIGEIPRSSSFCKPEVP